MPFFKPSSQRKLRKFFKKNGFKLVEGGEHCIATDASGITIVFPRHNTISSGVTMQICKKLIQMGFDKKEIEKSILK
jgi:hypothetical protein